MGNEKNESGAAKEGGEELEEWLSIPEAAQFLNTSERTVHRKIRRYSLRTKTVFTPRGKEIRISRGSLTMVAEEIAHRLADSFPNRRRDDPAEEQGGAATAGEPPATADLTKPTLSVSRDDLREVLAEAIAQGVSRVIERHAALLKPPPCAGRHCHHGSGEVDTRSRWLLFTGAALVTVIAAVAVAIMQQTLALA